MELFSLDQINEMPKKNIKAAVLTYLKEEIPNQFTTMSQLVDKFGSNARNHVKNLEKTKTFRIKKFNDKKKGAKKETEYWTYVRPELLNKEQLDTLVLLLNKEGYKVAFDYVEKPKVSKGESIVNAAKKAIKKTNK